MRPYDISRGKRLSYFCSLFFLVVFWACTKIATESKPTFTSTTSLDKDGYVIGPHGESIPAKNFHILEKGYKILIQNQHIYKAEIASGKIVEDWGVFVPYNATSQKGAMLSTVRPPYNGNGLKYSSTNWVAGEAWQAPAGDTINYFTATCIVPPLPTTQKDQIFSFWIGTGQSAMGTGGIVQPILNFGHAPQSSVINLYQVFNYYIWGAGAAMTTPEVVESGTRLQLIISNNGTMPYDPTHTSYDYVSNILGENGKPVTPIMDITYGQTYLEALPAESGNITIPGPVGPALYAWVVMENPNDSPNYPLVTSRSMYPNTPADQSYVAMTDIGISTGSTTTFNYPATLNWATAVSLFPKGPSLGETEQVVNNTNNSSDPGQINLWFACATPTAIMSDPSWSNATETLSWNPVPGATEYEVVINSGPHGGGAFYQTTATSISNFFSTLEQANTPGAYQVLLFALNSCGNGPSSTFNFNFCSNNLTAVGPPSWTNATETLSWGAVTGATGYQIIINSGPNGGGALYSTTATSIPNFFTTIEQNNTPGNYQVIITPQYSCGNGPSTYFNFTYSD